MNHARRSPFLRLAVACAIAAAPIVLPIVANAQSRFDTHDAGAGAREVEVTLAVPGVDGFEETLLLDSARHVIVSGRGETSASKLRVGDRIELERDSVGQVVTIRAAYAPSAATPEGFRVVGRSVRTSRRLVSVETDDDQFEVTPEHRFFVPARGWVPAGELASGDRLDGQAEASSANASTRAPVAVRVVRVDVRETAPRATFNLLVDGAHTYRVGKGQVLVHNGGCIEDAKKPPEGIGNYKRWSPEQKNKFIEDAIAGKTETPTVAPKEPSMVDDPQPDFDHFERVAGNVRGKSDELAALRQATKDPPPGLGTSVARYFGFAKPTDSRAEKALRIVAQHRPTQISDAVARLPQMTGTFVRRGIGADEAFASSDDILDLLDKAKKGEPIAFDATGRVTKAGDGGLLSVDRNALPRDLEGVTRNPADWQVTYRFHGTAGAHGMVSGTGTHRFFHGGTRDYFPPNANWTVGGLSPSGLNDKSVIVDLKPAAPGAQSTKPATVPKPKASEDFVQEHSLDELIERNVPPTEREAHIAKRTEARSPERQAAYERQIEQAKRAGAMAPGQTPRPRAKASGAGPSKPSQKRP